MTTIRIDEIRRDLEYIKKLPVLPRYMAITGKGEGDFWCQSVYGVKLECGTAACLAGWHLLLNGYRMERLTDGDGSPITAFYEPTGRWKIDPEQVARHDYGLTMDQAHQLFYAGNTLEQMDEMVNRWEAGEDYDHTIYPIENAA